MLDFLAENEAAVRLSAFLGVFVLFAGWELLSPRRALGADRLRRWPANLLILALDNLMLRLAFPILAAGTALWAEQADIGLFNNLNWPFWLEAIACLVVLDLSLYLQHLVFHRVPFLWRIHRIHHIDTHVDTTTALRFHPVEIALSMGIKMAIVAALGVAPVIVILFEVILNAAALFNHANVRLPKGADYLVRLFIVTPDMHRIHHSVNEWETNSNYGFGLSLWDRFFGTHTRNPEGGHEHMRIGQNGVGSETAANLWRILILPFRR